MSARQPYKVTTTCGHMCTLNLVLSDRTQRKTLKGKHSFQTSSTLNNPLSPVQALGAYLQAIPASSNTGRV